MVAPCALRIDISDDNQGTFDSEPIGNSKTDSPCRTSNDHNFVSNTL